MNTQYKHGLYSEVVECDLQQLQQTTRIMYDFISRSFKATESYNGNSTLITRLYAKYNFLMYPLPGIHKLYTNIQKVFNNSYKLYYGVDNTEEHFIQCWLNYYWKGDFIDWHGHWPPQYKSWHGFFCVDVGNDSMTTYKWTDDTLVDVPSQDGLMVMGISNGDKHKSSQWTHSKPRITVAFDIVPYYNGKINLSQNINHWIPI